MPRIFTPTRIQAISDAVKKIPENEELGEKLIEICLVILAKAVKLTKTDMDDRSRLEGCKPKRSKQETKNDKIGRPDLRSPVLLCKSN